MINLQASDLPRDTLWRVEQACLLSYRNTGLSFPCLEVDLSKGRARGFAILQAPFQQVHIVAIPTIRIKGIEDNRLRRPNAPNYFEAAWNARHYVEAAVKRTLAWNDFGLAVNSQTTRSQDQLHIHMDCVQPNVKAALADRLQKFSTASWTPAGFEYQGLSYWARRLDASSLTKINVFELASQISELREHPGLTTLGLIGVSERNADGFVVLAGLTQAHDPRSTAENLLDHSCGSAE